MLGRWGGEILFPLKGYKVPVAICQEESQAQKQRFRRWGGIIVTTQTEYLDLALPENTDPGFCGGFLRFFVCLFLGLHPQHMEIPRLGDELELQLPGYAAATAAQDLSHIYDIHHSSWHCRIFNPQSKARDQTHVLMDTSQIRFH